MALRTGAATTQALTSLTCTHGRKLTNVLRSTLAKPGRVRHTGGSFSRHGSSFIQVLGITSQGKERGEVLRWSPDGPRLTSDFRPEAPSGAAPLCPSPKTRLLRAEMKLWTEKDLGKAAKSS